MIAAPSAFSAWSRGWALPDRRPIPQWAAEHVLLGGGYARQGGFDIRTCRHLEAPFVAAADPRVREVTARAAIQTLKTLFVEIYVLWAIANEPGPLMWTQQDDASAKEHVKGRFRGLMQGCEPVSAIMPRDRHDKGTMEIFFGDFYLIVNGANLNNLQSKSIRHKINSECWLWKQGLLTHARRRVSAYERDGLSKILNESQGSHADDDFDKLWHEGSREVWAVPCAGCGVLSPLEFFGRMVGDEKVRAGVVWDEGAKRADGSWDEARVRASARYRCAVCGHEHENSARTRAAWNAGGAYTAPRVEADGRHRSFAWNALIAEDLGKLAMEFLSAEEFKKRGVLQPLKDFWMQRLALAWRDQAETATVGELPVGAYTLAEVAQEPAKLIEGEVVRVMTVDRQRDHFWAVVMAWRRDGTARLLWRGKVLTVEQVEEVRRSHGVKPERVCEDAQYDTAQVYADCVRLGWTALHGSGDDGFTHLLPGGKKVTRFYSPVKKTQVPGGSAPYFFWASDPVKDMLAALLRERQLELPADGGEELARQLRGETKRERVSKATGRSEWRWAKIGPNHYWDCCAMQVAVALVLRILRAAEEGGAAPGASGGRRAEDGGQISNQGGTD